ncbi:MAG: dimethylarginine dimethylaminohydrolase family protein [Pararhodobacter sp.]
MSGSTFNASAYGGQGWQGRATSHAQEIGTLWACCGIDSEYAPLRAVVMHEPGAELGKADPEAANLLEHIDWQRAAVQHRAIADAYRAAGVAVHPVAPEGMPSANQMFCADLMAATPEGVILARPASVARAGEERWVARRLADLGVPILCTLTGDATFEGADMMLLDPRTAILGRGLRTNDAGIAQVSAALGRIGIEALVVDMPFGTMHLMGMLRFADADLAIAWPRRTPFAAVQALRARGYRVEFLPDEDDNQRNRAMNFVTLGPRRILMVGNCPAARQFYEGLGIYCTEVDCSELAKAAGAIGCLTGVLERAPAGR